VYRIVRSSVSLGYSIDLARDVAIASRQTKAAAWELKEKARSIRWRHMIAGFILFLITRVYERQYDWSKVTFEDIARPERKAFEIFFLGCCRTNGHSRSCQDFEDGYPEPTERDVLTFIEVFGTRGSDLTKEPWLSVARGRQWRQVYAAVCANYHGKHSTMIMRPQQTRYEKTRCLRSYDRDRDQDRGLAHWREMWCTKDYRPENLMTVVQHAV
jgi:hypothetical protein